ncbi:MAG: FeoB-associated Cys-rich membrane protein [Lachnospiraceae bacterium]|jgi:hypothetical protein|nr:FeoB-associated Cys-rich membrane protein [Lachnospiraceae bacterium]
MFDFLYGNLMTILIGLLVLGLAALAVRSIWRDKKQGKSCGSCGGNCSGCAMNVGHKKEEAPKS